MGKVIDADKLIKELKKYGEDLERFSGDSYAGVVKSCIQIVEEQPEAEKENQIPFVSLNEEMIRRSTRERYSSNDRQFGY